MAQLAKALAVEPDNPSLWVLVVEGESQFLKVVFWGPHEHHCALTHSLHAKIKRNRK